MVKSLRKWGLAVAKGPALQRVKPSLKAAVLGLVAGIVVFGSPAVARPAEEPQLPAISLLALPSQAQDTHRLILSGGPFPYEKDGTVFGNRERLLPPKQRGWYREYTVRTPGQRNRGARRIVCGGEPPQKPEVCYYTADHYESFSRIVP